MIQRQLLLRPPKKQPINVTSFHALNNIVWQKLVLGSNLSAGKNISVPRRIKYSAGAPYRLNFIPAPATTVKEMDAMSMEFGKKQRPGEESESDGENLDSGFETAAESGEEQDPLPYHPMPENVNLPKHNRKSKKKAENR